MSAVTDINQVIEKLGFNKKLKTQMKNSVKKMFNDMDKTFNESIECIYTEAWKMYDSFIDQFYAYKTTSYIRHGETKPGTMVGSNLYRGQDFRFDPNKLTLDLDFSSKDMQEGYQYDKAKDVLFKVMRGYRFKAKNIDVIEWRGSYSSKYLNPGTNITMEEAFDYFINNSNKILVKIFNEKWRY